MPNPKISQIVVGNTLYDIKDAVARNDIAALDNEVDVLRAGFVTPEMFGAKGDGETDDTQAFVDALAVSDFILGNPKKEYLVGTGVVGDILTVNQRNNVTICANFLDNRELVNQQNATKAVIKVVDSDYFRYKGSIKSTTDLAYDYTQDELINEGAFGVKFYGDCGYADVDIYGYKLRSAIGHGEWSNNTNELNGNVFVGLHDSKLRIVSDHCSYGISLHNANENIIDCQFELVHRSMWFCGSGNFIRCVGKNFYSGGTTAALLLTNGLDKNGNTIGASNNHIQYIENRTTHRVYGTIVTINEIEFSYGGHSAQATEFIGNVIELSGTNDTNVQLKPISIDENNLPLHSKVQLKIVDNMVDNSSGTTDFAQAKITTQPGMDIDITQTYYKDYRQYVINDSNADSSIKFHGSIRSIVLNSLSGFLSIQCDRLRQLTATAEINTPVYIEGNYGAVYNTNIKNIRFNGATGNAGADNALSGNTSSRPVKPQRGKLYYDTTLTKLIVWNGTTWVNVDGTALA